MLEIAIFVFLLGYLALLFALFVVLPRGRQRLQSEMSALEGNVAAQESLVTAQDGLVTALQNELSVKNELIAAMKQRLDDQGAIMRAAFPHMVIFNKEEAPCDK